MTLDYLALPAIANLKRPDDHPTRERGKGDLCLGLTLRSTLGHRNNVSRPCDALTARRKADPPWELWTR